MKSNRQIRGQGLVEFALVLPLILLIIIVFIELGRIVYFYSALNNAVREGARYLVVTQFSASDDIESTIYDKVAQYAVALPLNPADITVYCDQDEALLINDNHPCDDYVTVSADFEIEPMVVVFAQMIGVGDTFQDYYEIHHADDSVRELPETIMKKIN